MIALALFMLAAPAAAQIPAFPGAEGAGAFATGGRGGQVYVVANLNAQGPGSLADAVSQPNRIVVFAVSGTIDLTRADGKKGKLLIAQPGITIAGQTAPGEGICLRGGALEVAAGNVIIRHLRIRRGFNRTGDMGDALDIKGEFENVIVDHVSTSWATDENLTLTNANRVTAQYSIAAEGLDYANPNQTPNRHSEGSLFGSAYENGRMTIHHTLYAHNRLRNARTTGGKDVIPTLDFRNNVIYDVKELATHTGSQGVHLNVVNNYYKDGPSTGLEGHDIKGVIFTFMSAGPHRMYIAGNHVDASPARTADNWQAVRYTGKGKTVQEKDVRSETPMATPAVTTQSAREAFETVLAEAGATLPARDAVDLRVVGDVRRGTGAVVNYETDIPEAGRWQTYHSLPAAKDSDGDGIPDYWAKQFGLPPNSAVADPDGDGYTNIEEYINNTDPTGGTQPLVYASATVSRAWRATGTPGELQIARTGSTEAPLKVNYTLGGVSKTAVILAGARAMRIPVAATEKGLVVLTLQPGEGYHIGCPISALVAIQDGAAPAPVELAKVDSDGGVTQAVRKAGEETMARHKVEKTTKVKDKHYRAPGQ
jgi:hypothetical protein